MMFKGIVVAMSVSLALLAQGSEKTASETKSGGELGQRVDEVFYQWDKPDSPGCALLVFKQGTVVYERGYGMANLDLGTPVSATTVFDIGSISKQFTAACIVLLAEHGKILLDDDIRKYLPEFPDYGHTITIRHLLHHTSGIRDYPWLMLLARMEFGDADEQARQEILDLITRQRQLYFPPGDDHYYSNSNYFLLGTIVERVSGLSLGEYAAHNIFEPLGMRDTLFREDKAKPIENRAVGYIPNTDGTFQTGPDRIMFGAGGVNTTARDLSLWSQNFRTSQIGGPDFTKTMLRRGKLNTGEPIKYACGLEIGEYKGLETVSFMGYTEAFASYMVRFPEQELSIICLANLGSVRPHALATKVADLYLAGQLQVQEKQTTPAPSEQVAASIDPSVYDAYVGSYRFEFGLLMTFTREDGRFLMQAGKQPKVELFPESETHFFLKGADVKVSFSRNENGGVTGITLNQKGQVMVAKRVELESILPPERLEEFAGRYFNDELEVIYTVVLSEGQLSVAAPRDFRSDLRHVEGDQFAMSRGDMIFHRGDRGAVTDFLLDVRTERLRFSFVKTVGQ